MDLARSVSAVLDLVLVPLGFAAAQAGETHATFCAGHDELSDRSPGLPQANVQERGSTCCVDLTIGYEDGMDVHLEGPTLAETLRALGLLEDAETVENLGTRSLDDALSELADVLPRLFRAAGTPGTP